MGNGLLVGCGKMGSALLTGWLARIADPDFPLRSFHVVDPVATIPEHASVTPYRDAAKVPDTVAPSCIIIAVKPQSIEAILPSLVRFVPRGVFLSIAAGKSIDSFTAVLGSSARVVRAMPNTPAIIARGISAIFANPRAFESDHVLCQSLLQVVGEVEWLSSEPLMDAVTAVSGSGPAYVFLLIEAMRGVGEAMGLQAELADRLARATVAGSGELALRGVDVAELRRNVTSPGGTTEAALQVLMGDGGMVPLFRQAMMAARQKARDLA